MPARKESASQKATRDSTGRVCSGSLEACCRMPRRVFHQQEGKCRARWEEPRVCSSSSDRLSQSVSASADYPPGCLPGRLSSKTGLGMVALVLSREALGVQARGAPEALVVIIVVVSVSRLVGAGGPGPLEVVDVPECLITRSSRAPRPLGPLRETPPGPHGWWCAGSRWLAGWSLGRGTNLFSRGRARAASALFRPV